jgi:succinyl-diaminopimelate desuccinylase
MNLDAAIARARQWIDDHRDEMVVALQEQLRIPSKQGEPQDGAPFGVECRQALDAALALAASAGFTVKNLDGYAGHAEFGDGGEMVMALAHLDVVPEGEGWQHDPFGATIEEGYIYARGSVDDKGPAYAALLAAQALKETGVHLPRRLRVVFGCNEESGFGCVKHYFAHEEAPAYGFAPDAVWPLVYAEKGICNLTLTKQLAPAAGLQVVSASGGERPNMVPDSAQAVLEGPEDALASAARLLDDYWDKNVSHARDDGQLSICATGRAAHASTPFEGDSALVRLLRVLRQLKPEGTEEWIQPLFEAGDPGGAGLGIHGRDEIAGDLTSNLGVLNLADGKLEALFNIRHPVEWQGDEVQRRNAKMRDKHGFEIRAFACSPPLHVPLNCEPVKTILAVAREELGEEAEPETMGGGTYARAVANTVAVGTCWPGDGPPHEPNERYAVLSYLRAAKIYAHIFLRLASVA